MKIEKYKRKKWFYYYNYYEDSKTYFRIHHGLYNSYYDYGIGYCYHNERKGFWLRNKKYV